MTGTTSSVDTRELAEQLESLKLADSYDFSSKCTECESEPLYQCSCSKKWCQEHYDGHNSTNRCTAGYLAQDLSAEWKTVIESSMSHLKTFHQQTYRSVHQECARQIEELKQRMTKLQETTCKRLLNLDRFYRQASTLMTRMLDRNQFLYYDEIPFSVFLAELFNANRRLQSDLVSDFLVYCKPEVQSPPKPTPVFQQPTWQPSHVAIPTAHSPPQNVPSHPSYYSGYVQHNPLYQTHQPRYSTQPIHPDSINPQRYSVPLLQATQYYSTQTLQYGASQPYQSAAVLPLHVSQQYPSQPNSTQTIKDMPRQL